MGRRDRYWRQRRTVCPWVGGDREVTLTLQFDFPSKMNVVDIRNIGKKTQKHIVFPCF